MGAYGAVNVVAIAGVMSAWLLFLIGVIALPKPKGGPPAKRDLSSTIGIVLQGIAFAAVWLGPMRAAIGPPATADIAPGAAVASAALLSVGLFIWAASTMGKHWAFVARARVDHELVQKGPFALMRHPIYVALFGMMAATALALGHAPNLLVAVPVYLLGTVQRVLVEEKILRAVFPEAYPAYAKRVKRFIPGLI